MEFLTICEPFFSMGTTACLEYMMWFIVFGKSYLLSVEVRVRQLCQKSQRRLAQQHRVKRDRTTNSSSASTKEVSAMSTQYLDQLTPLIPIHFTNPMYFSQASHYATPHFLYSFVLVSTNFGALKSFTFYMPTSMPSQMPS